MNPETPKWLGKAEGDFHTARRELRARRVQDPRSPAPAGLVSAGSPAARCLPPLAILKNFAVHIRYPGEDTTPTEARDVLRRAEAIRTAVHDHLGLPG